MGQAFARCGRSSKWAWNGRARENDQPTRACLGRFRRTPHAQLNLAIVEIDNLGPFGAVARADSKTAESSERLETDLVDFESLGCTYTTGPQPGDAREPSPRPNVTSPEPATDRMYTLCMCWFLHGFGTFTLIFLKKKGMNFVILADFCCDNSAKVAAPRYWTKCTNTNRSQDIQGHGQLLYPFTLCCAA